MKLERIINSNNKNPQPEMKALPNSEMLSQQIENLRVVLRRMKANDSSSLDTIIKQKLNTLK
jgi:hypothetical protein